MTSVRDRVRRGSGSSMTRDLVSASLRGRLPVVLILVLMIIVFGITGQGFFTSISFQNITSSTSLFLLIALGETFVMISGGIDISLASNLAFSALTAGILMTKMYHGHGDGALIVIEVAVLTIIVGSLIGMINGLIISFLKISPLIVTLGSWGAFFGLAEWLSVKYPIGTLPPVLPAIVAAAAAAAALGGVHAPAIAATAGAAVAAAA